MQVEAKFICAEIVGPLRDGAYEIPEGATVSDLLECCRAECPNSHPISWASQLMFLKNGMQAQMDTQLSPGDKVHFLRKIFGG